jgi:hypothetical protein
MPNTIDDISLPNIFGASITFTQREEADLAILQSSPLLRKLINYHLRNEYQALLDRNPMRLAPEDIKAHHAYLTGAYALANNLVVPTLDRE